MKNKSKQNNISVLIPDGESHLTISVVNCLSQKKEVDVYVMSKTKHNQIRYSRYVKKFIFYAETDSDLDWVEHINKTVEVHHIDVIIPIFETRIKTLIKNKSKINQQDKLGLLASLSDYQTAFNKDNLTKHLEANSLPFAKSVILDAYSGLDQVKDLNFPVIVKPAEGYGGGQGIHKFNSLLELKFYFEKNDLKYENIVQEYVNGYDIDCSILCKKGEILAYTIQKGNMMGANQFSPQYGLKFLNEDELLKTVKKIMKSLNWSGVAHIDMRYDKHTNQFKAIEINTRFWVSLEASLLAGVNFPYLYILASMNKPFNLPEYQPLDYVNFKGLIKKTKQDFRYALKAKSLKNGTSLKFALKDPIPLIYKFVWRTKNILKSRFKN